MKNLLSHAFNYISLTNEENKRVIRQDIFPAMILALLISAPFIYIDNTSFFSPGGFVEKFGQITSILIGFYIASLVAVATINSPRSKMDKQISNGEVFKKVRNEKVSLTRRQYVCSLFQFLTTSSILISLISIIVTQSAKTTGETLMSIDQKVPQLSLTTYDLARGTSILIYAFTISIMIIITIRGIRYLSDKIFEEIAEEVADKNRFR